MRSATAALALAASLFASATYAKVDRLVSSRRLAKRALDDEGLYNVTILHTNDVRNRNEPLFVVLNVLLYRYTHTWTNGVVRSWRVVAGNV